MEFNGFEVFPAGNAELSIEDDRLIVSGITDSGLDGVLIKTTDRGNYTVNFGSLASIPEARGVLKTSTLVRNPIGQVVTFFESFKWYDPESDQVQLGYNLNYLPDSFNVFGSLDGERVFDIHSSEFPFPEPEGPSVRFLGILGLVVSIAAVAVAIWAELRTKKTTETTRNYDSAGNLTSYSVTVSEDPVPFEVQVNGEMYTVDEIGVYYDSSISGGLIGSPSMDFESAGELITAFNLPSFEITSIEPG